jgi:ParB-like chromosome segregation protein Spo0J
MIIEKINIKELKPNPKNPRKSTPEQEAQLKKSLEKFGVVEPIVYNKQTGNIVGGHFRVRELKKLGIKEVECVVVDLTQEDENELNIRLNANKGDWDWEMLAMEWDADKLEEWGLDLPELIDPSEQDDLSDKIKEKFLIEIDCEDETRQEQVYNKLIGEGYKCRLLTL